VFRYIYCLCFLWWTLGPSALAVPQAAPSAAGLRVTLRLQGVSDELRLQLEGLPQIQLTQSDSDLLLRSNGHELELYDRSDGLIRSFASNESEALVKRIAAEPELRKLLDWHFPVQSLKLTMQVVEPAHRTEYFKGDHIKVVMTPDQPSYLLLLDVDPDGSISVLYPASSEETGKAPAGVQQKGMEGVIGEPLGTEFLKLFAFREKPAGFERWYCSPSAAGALNCPKLLPGTPQFRELINLLEQAPSDSSQTSLRITSHRVSDKGHGSKGVDSPGKKGGTPGGEHPGSQGGTPGVVR